MHFSSHLAECFGSGFESDGLLREVFTQFGSILLLFQDSMIDTRSGWLRPLLIRIDFNNFCDLKKNYS